MPVFKDHSFRFGASAQSAEEPPYLIPQAIRFAKQDSAYMYRNTDTTFQNKFTISLWWKRGAQDRQYLLTWRDKRGSGYAYSGLWTSSDQLIFFEYSDHSAHGLNQKAYYSTNRVLVDSSAWYHIVMSIDYSDTVADEAVKMYINGERQTSLANSLNNTSYAGQSQSTGSPNHLGIGYLPALGTTDIADCLMADIFFIDGQALTPGDFGKFDTHGNWIPIEYEGTFGNESFHIDGRDSSDLGDDESGQGNDFTTTGLAVNDQMTHDTPNNVFASIVPHNALMHGALHQNNQRIVMSGDEKFKFDQELSFNSYCEVRIDAQSSNGGTIGFGTFGGDDDDNSVVFQTNYSSGYIYLNGGNASANIGGTVSVGDIIMMAYNPTTRKWWVGVNGTWRNSGNPAGGTGEVYAHAADAFEAHAGDVITWGGWKGSANGLTLTWNMGQDSTFCGQESAGSNEDSAGIGSFKYAVPSGFYANCTRNLFNQGS